MPIELQKDAERYSLGSIKRFVAETLDSDILAGTRYEAEFDYWKK